MLSDRLATDLRPGRNRLEIHVWLGKSLPEKTFKSDLRPIYDHADWHMRPLSELRSTCKDLWPKEDQAVSWVTCKWNRQVPQPFSMVKSSCGACRFLWRLGQSYREYSGVTYDLLVNNIGGTYETLLTNSRVTTSFIQTENRLIFHDKLYPVQASYHVFWIKTFLLTMCWSRIHDGMLVLWDTVHCQDYIDGLVQDCSNSIANALELLQSCTKPSTYSVHTLLCFVLLCFAVVWYWWILQRPS